MVHTSFSFFNSGNFFVLIIASCIITTSPQNTKCPFNFLYHFGDGVYDTGNAIATPLIGSQLPAAKSPYGKTFPGNPTGRWSDGRIDIDYAGQYLGFSGISNYLSNNLTANAITFAVANSPVLDTLFFLARGVTNIPLYAASINVQLSWFRKHIFTVIPNSRDRASRLANSIVIFGDVEANDITSPLIQGKSIQEVMDYSARVTNAQVNAAREVIRMGATRVLFSGNAPLGCFPFILTELHSNNPTDYDDLGCLKSVNNLITSKNNGLLTAIDALRQEFPSVFFLYVDFYNAELSLIREMISSPNGNKTLKACCGIGGNYNYDRRRFCGSTGVTDCSDPNNYLFWDGVHLTQEAYNRNLQISAQPALVALNCTFP